MPPDSTPADDPKPLHVAIVAWNALPVVFPTLGRAVGGMETFAWRFARALVRLPDLKVSLVVRHTRRPPLEAVDGVHLVACIEPLRDVRLSVAKSLEIKRNPLRMRVKRLQHQLLWQVPMLAAAGMWQSSERRREQLRRSLERVKPTVWVVLGCSQESALVISTAAKRNEPCLLWVRSNADLDERFFSDAGFVNAYNVTADQARACLTQCTEVICQTLWQLEQLKRLTGRAGHLIPNPVVCEEWATGNRDIESRPTVLWVGRYDEHHKRPELAIEVARRLPEIQFTMVINAGSPDVQRRIQSHLPPNVQVVDYVPREQMPAVFSRARLFLSTGSGRHEGFPNVLLEAAAAGVPIVSLEDFDGFLARSGAGTCAEGDPVKAAEVIESLWDDPRAWESLARAGQEYVKQHHRIEHTVRQFLQLTKELGEAE